MSPDYLIMSVPWGSCEDGVANINKVFSFDGEASYEVNWAAKPAQRMANVKNHAPEIQIMDALGGYATYYYVKNAHLKDGVTEVKGWCNNNGVYADDLNSESMPGNVTPGVSIWFRYPDSAEKPVTTTAGQVPTATVTIDCVADFRMRAPAFPKELHINNPDEIDFGTLTPTHEVNWAGKPAQRMVNVKGKAPEIQVMNALGGYSTYYYVKNAHLKDGVTEVAGWCNSNGVYADAENGGSLPGNVPVGYGFWIRGLEGGDFTMTLKY